MGRPRVARVADPLDAGSRRTEILNTAATLIAASGLRTSLQEIAEAAGILPGSLYHHFESKEAILVELLHRFHTDLDHVADEALERLDQTQLSAFNRITDLSCAIARCAVTHTAALQMSYYESPSANPELIELTQRRPAAVMDAMLQTLRAARWNGYLDAGTDLPLLADRMCQAMLHVGLDVMRHNAATDKAAILRCRILLEGLAAVPPTDDELDGSAAFAAADNVIRAWRDEGTRDDKATLVRAVARSEFGRRGYENTTVRDIAAAAGLGTGTVYRLIGSKDELLVSIMKSFGEKIAIGWDDVMRSDATPIEKLDAVSWINTNVLDQFGDEFRIQLAWMRQSPPDTPNPGWQFASRLRQMKALIAEAVRSGEIRIDSPSMELLARSVIGIGYVPENVLHERGIRAAQLHVRDTSLRGVINRHGR